jgi:UDP-glucose 4-epimerase
VKYRRVLLTGGAGLIGSTITDLLTGESEIEKITIFDNFSRGTMENLADAVSDARVDVIRGDILDLETLDRAVRGHDAIFHLPAIRITQCALEPRLANDILVNGTFNVLEAAVRHDVGKIIASSSASVYGLANTFPTDERHHPYNNDTLYGAAKAYNEGMLRSFKATYDLDYVALRYFNVYGPRMDTVGKYTEVFIRWMNAIARGEAPVIHGDGSTTMDFVYVGDIARANVCALKSNATDHVFNVGTGIETSLADLARTIISVMGADVEPIFENAPSSGGVTRRKADVSKAETLLGFRAETTFEEGVRKLVDWWRSSHHLTTETTSR